MRRRRTDRPLDRNTAQSASKARHKTKGSAASMSSESTSNSPPKSGNRRLFVAGSVAMLIGVIIGAIFLVREATKGRENASTSLQGDGTSSSNEDRPAVNQSTPSASARAATSTSTPSAPPTNSPVFTKWGSYELLETIPHDPTAFTQGLCTVLDLWSLKYVMYEGTGIHGASQLRLLDMNGTVLSHYAIGNDYFGEGIAHYREPLGTTIDDTTTTFRFLQLTWKEQVAFEYKVTHHLADGDYAQMAPEVQNEVKLSTPPPAAKWNYSTTTNEGWGITYVPEWHQWIVSDGSHYLHFWNATSRQEIKRILVMYQLEPVDGTAAAEAPRPMAQLNELEWDPHSRTVLANIWLEDLIVRIDPLTGLVVTIYDFRSLYPNRPAGVDVLNGIALTYDSSLPPRQQGIYSPDNETLSQVWVTGKYWPSMYRVSLVD